MVCSSDLNITAKHKLKGVSAHIYYTRKMKSEEALMIICGVPELRKEGRCIWGQ